MPVILFPRGAGLLYRDFATASGAAGLSLDSSLPLDWAAAELQPHLAVQGNLDPMLLLAGGAAMDREVKRILRRPRQGPFVFNLGHGILPETPHRACRAAGRAGPQGAGDDDQARGRAVQSRRAGQPGGGRALPLQSVQRSRDHPPAAAAALGAGAADRAPAGAGGARDLRPSRRRLAAAGQYRGPGRRRSEQRSMPRADRRRRSSSPCATGVRSRHETARAVEAYGPDEIVLLPLYPQYSTTTTASSSPPGRGGEPRPGSRRRPAPSAAIRRSGLHRRLGRADRAGWPRPSTASRR